MKDLQGILGIKLITGDTGYDCSRNFKYGQEVACSSGSSPSIRFQLQMKDESPLKPLSRNYASATLAHGIGGSSQSRRRREFEFGQVLPQ